jgi:hypothetical protein
LPELRQPAPGLSVLTSEQEALMKALTPCLLAASIAVAAPCAFAKTVKTDGTDDQRVTEGVSGPVDAAPHNNKTVERDKSVTIADKDKGKKAKAKPQHLPPPPLHDPN